MTKKITPFNAYIGASEASDLLSKKLGRYVSSEYIRKLARRKKNPVRTEVVSNRLLYHRDDILASNVRQRPRRRKGQPS